MSQDMDAAQDMRKVFLKTFGRGLGLYFFVLLGGVSYCLIGADDLREEIISQVAVEHLIVSDGIELHSPVAAVAVDVVEQIAVVDEPSDILDQHNVVPQVVVPAEDPIHIEDSLEPALSNSSEHNPVDDVVLDVQASIDVLAQDKRYIQALYSHNEFGWLPHEIKGDSSSAKVFDAFARPVDAAVYNQPVVAIVMTGVERSSAFFHEVVEALPSDVTYMVSPYSDVAQGDVQYLRSRGIEAWLKVYLGRDDSGLLDGGRHSLLSFLSSRENEDRFKQVIGTTPAVSGVAIHGDPSYFNLVGDGRAFLDLVHRYGLGVASSLQSKELGYMSARARQIGLPFAQSDFTLDTIPIEQDMLDILAQVESQAKKDGVAVVYFEGYPASLSVIENWISGLKSSGIELVPLSAIAVATSKERMKMRLEGRSFDVPGEPDHMPTNEGHEPPALTSGVTQPSHNAGH